MTKIIKNAAQCNNCLDVIESKHCHDFVRCSCGQIAVDGGREYIRRVVEPGGSYEDLSISEVTD